jgi:hypothetical protein
MSADMPQNRIRDYPLLNDSNVLPLPMPAKQVSGFLLAGTGKECKVRFKIAEIKVKGACVFDFAPHVQRLTMIFSQATAPTFFLGLSRAPSRAQRNSASLSEANEYA